MKLAITVLSFSFLIGSISGRGLRPRIIGGNDAQIEDFPYQVSLRMFGNHYCGGSIISERHILTAAHCIYATMFLEVHTGTDSYNESGILRSFDDIKVHPDWVKSKALSYRNDIAVITLTEKISFDKYHRKIDLPSKEVQSGVKAILTGWGRTSRDPNSARPMQLQKLEMTILLNTDCQKDQSDEIYEEQLCAIHSKQTGACFGDSGGPLVVDGEIVGIPSWVHGDCAAGSPDIYTNVYAYRDFIESVMNE